MNFIRNIRISTIGWILISFLTVSGSAFIYSSKNTIENIQLISRTWHNFEENRSEKGSLLSALHKEIGYGGMIHNFKNFILRQDEERGMFVTAKLGAALSAIDNYDTLELDAQEKAAAQAIRNMLNSYFSAHLRTMELVSQGNTAAEIDALVRVDDGAAYQALKMLDQKVNANKDEHITIVGKSQTIAKLRQAMGYGGMIHHFKNLVLRGDQQLIAVIEQDIDSALTALQTYYERDINELESNALDAIVSVLEAYRAKLPIINNLIAEGHSPAYIDGIVKVDDTPALTAFDTLTRQISIQNQEQAQEVDDAMVQVLDIAESAIYATSILLAIIIAFVLWLFRSQIAYPIKCMTTIMTKLSNGELDIEIPATQQRNEIGAMAQALEVFRRTANERNKAEQHLRDREERMSAILDNVLDGIITISDKGIIATVNPAAEKIFGYDKDDIIGQNINCLMPEPYRSEHDGYLQAYEKTGEAQIIGIGREVTGQRRDHSTFPMELAVAEIEVAEERLFLGVVRDITERKRIDQMKSEFISTVSHELRTPLTSIRGSLGLVRGGAVGELPSAAQDMLNIAYNNTERLLLLINDILDIQKIESGKLTLKYSNLPIMPFLEQAIAEHMGYAQEQGVTFAIKQKVDAACSVYADKDRLMQVVANLLSNAAKFSPEGETIEISAAKTDKGLIRVSVSDRGPGIPEEFKSKIFERFTQSDSSDTRQKGGTGLGLAVSKAIMERHNGQIGFISHKGIGTTFFFEIPMYSEVDTDSPKRSQLKVAKPTILIVEDDQDVAALIQRMLTEEGFNSDIAYSAEQARELLAERGDFYRLMTLDIILPGEDGISLLSSLREDAATINLPVIVLSAIANETKAEVNGGAINVLDWMQKPIDQGRLANALKNIPLAEGQRPQVLHVEDEADVHQVVSVMLQNDCEMTWASTVKESRTLLEAQKFDLVILDIGLPDGSGLELLDVIESRTKPPRVVIFSAMDVSTDDASRVNAVLVKSRSSNAQLMNVIKDSLKPV